MAYKQRPNGLPGNGGPGKKKNPYYKKQLKEYSSFSDPSKRDKNLTVKITDPNALKAYQSKMSKADPMYSGMTVKELYTDKSGQNTYPVYNKPSQTISSSAKPVSNPKPKAKPTYRDANTGEALITETYGRPQGSKSYQFKQSLEQQANTPERKKARADVKAQISKNKELLNKMTEAQKSEMRSRNQTPSQYFSAGDKGTSSRNWRQK